MRTKKEIHEPRLTGEQIIQKKLDEVNEMLQKTDLSRIIGNQPKKNGKVEQN
jgi:hypothetical protein